MDGIPSRIVQSPMPARRLFVLTLVPLGLVAGLGTLWWVLNGPGQGDARSGNGSQDSEQTSSSQGGLSTPAAAQDNPRQSAQAGTDRASFDLERAVWATGRLEAPTGTPFDETLEVLGLVLDDKLVEDVLAAPDREQALAQALAPFPDSVTHEISRRPVAADGSFRLPFPGDARYGLILIDGRYLYLERPLGFTLEAARGLRLEARLGAWLSGRCRLPVNLEPTPELREQMTIELVAWSRERGVQKRATRPSAELNFEFRALPSEPLYSLRADPRSLAPIVRNWFQVRAGRQEEIELVFERGARIAGRVVDSEGTPVAAAAITPQGAGNGQMGFDRSTQTDSEGRFAIDGLPTRAGEVVLRVEKRGYLPLEAERIEVAGGGERTGIELVLGRGHSLSGRVEWPDSKPAAAAFVRVSRSPGAKGAQAGARTQNSPSNRSGEFQVDGLGPGPYLVSAEAIPPADLAAREEGDSGHPLQSLRWRTRCEGVAADTQDLVLVLERPLTLAGVVVDDAGAGLSNFRIEARPEGSSYGAQTQRASFGDAQGGSFVLDGLYPGSWRIQVEADGYRQRGPAPLVQVPRPADPLRLTLDRVATLTGFVLDPAGTPVAGAEVFVEAGQGKPRRRRRHESVKTDELGAFELGGLGPGVHSLVAQAEGWAQGRSEALEVQPGELREGLTIFLSEGGHIQGEIYDPRGEPDAGRNIQLMSLGRSLKSSGSTDSGGRFEFHNVTPGTYQLIAQPGVESLAQAEEASSEAAAMAAVLAELRMATVEVIEGETSHVVLGALAESPVRVQGRVTSGGAPLEAALVMALSEGKSLLESLRSATTGPDGSYSLTLDEPGPFAFVVRSEGMPDGVDFYVDVPEQSVFQLDLELPLASISGTVFGPEGTPLTGVEVRLSCEGNLDITMLDGPTSVRTDAQGRYVFTRLHAGSYAVRTGGEEAEAGVCLGWQVRSGLVLDGDRALTDVDFELDSGGTIRGVVRDAAGVPVSGAAVFVRDAAGQLLQRFSSVASDASGSFSYEGVSPGSYRVSARTESLASGESPAVRVSEAQSSAVELSLRAGTLLTVLIEDVQGKPVRASLIVTDERGFELQGMLARGNLNQALVEGYSASRRRIGPLPPGRYRLQASTADGLRAEESIRIDGSGQREVRLKLD